MVVVHAGLRLFCFAWILAALLVAMGRANVSEIRMKVDESDYV